ncbi:hypothetical protein B7C51_15705 [Paenibacillus larvae subsp. pulvifaciens]|uniref:Uncharacterized protein n=1 Tax=Paenibacillus larvae subsp. pulvifaciens TaxID=1477 RepID=A0A1V0UUM3_9BACL|nr:hypothetical protein [Paenibacillus larvae]ARF68935.1 hypothetical protein B7C51_15705 [Paenibacillus larvae subsp. pulvifaciens]
MDKLRSFYLRAESFVKGNVDFKTAAGLSDESFDRFVSKMVILLSRDTFPKKHYGLSRDKVREIFLNFYSYFSKPILINVKENKAFCYEIAPEMYRMVFARSKKQALEIIYADPLFITISTAALKRSMQRVVDSGTGFVITDKGERRELDVWSNTINLYGNGVAVEWSEVNGE